MLIEQYTRDIPNLKPKNRAIPLKSQTDPGGLSVTRQSRLQSYRCDRRMNAGTSRSRSASSSGEENSTAGCGADAS